MEKKDAESLASLFAGMISEEICKRVEEFLTIIDKHNSGEPWKEGEAGEFVERVDNELFRLNYEIFGEDIDEVAEAMYHCESLTPAYDSRFKPREIWFGPVDSQQIADDIFGTESDGFKIDPKYPKVKYIRTIFEPIKRNGEVKMIRVPKGAKFDARGGVFACGDEYFFFDQQGDIGHYYVMKILYNESQNRFDLISMLNEEDFDHPYISKIVDKFVETVKLDSGKDLEVKKFSINKPDVSAFSVDSFDYNLVALLFRNCPLLHDNNTLERLNNIAKTVLSNDIVLPYMRTCEFYKYVASRPEPRGEIQPTKTAEEYKDAKEEYKRCLLHAEKEHREKLYAERKPSDGFRENKGLRSRMKDFFTK